MEGHNEERHYSRVPQFGQHEINWLKFSTDWIAAQLAMNDEDPTTAAHQPRTLSWPQYENGGMPMPEAAGEDDNNYYASDHSPVDDIDAFGTLETPDATFLVTTRTVIIGRDQVAFKRYKAQWHWEQKVNTAKALGQPPPEPPAILSRSRAHAAPSSSGGLLPEEMDHRPPARKRKHGQVSDEYMPQYYGDEEAGIGQSLYHTPNSAWLDPNKHRPAEDRPAEDHPARLFIHGQGPHFYQTTKGISREHLKIQYNSARRAWEAHGLGRNGFFCNDEMKSAGESMVLLSGYTLQIQSIPIVFRLKNVADGKDGSELAYSGNGKSMSFDFTSSHHAQAGDTDDEMEDAAPNAAAAAYGEDSNDYAVDDEEAGEDHSENIRETVEKQEQSPDNTDQLAQVPYAPKKRGPGRPPKNGIMSKREEKLLRKQLQEEAKKNLPQHETSEQALKRKMASSKKDELDGSVEKRPYKVRKKGEEGTEDPEGDKPAKERSQKHKTPPLELRKEDFTEEQLQKPTKNYQLLIDEVMATAPAKGYSLKQIYKRIQEKWPHFYFRVDTKGWESSVRHNLLGSECFKKIDGNWHRVAGVPLDAGKKRKPSDSAADPRPVMYNNGYSQPPYQHHQPGQPGPPHGQHQLTHPTGIGHPNLPPRYPPNGQAYQIRQGSHPNSNQTGGPPPPQGPPRPGFPQHQVPAPGTGNAFVHNGPPRPQFPGSQLPAYHRPAPPPNPFLPEVPLPAPTAYRPPVARRGAGPPPQQSMPVAQPGLAAIARTGPAAVPQHLQPLPASLAPIIDPVLRDLVREFRSKTVTILRAKLGQKAETMAMSVISLGLRLTKRTLVPEAKDFEQPFLTLFHQHMMLYPKHRARVAASVTRASSSGDSHAKQASKDASETGLGTSKTVPATGNTEVPATVGTVLVKPGAASSEAVTGTKPSTPVSVNSTSVPTAPAAPLTASRPSSGPDPDRTSNVGAAEPASGVDNVPRGGQSNARAVVSGAVSPTSVPAKDKASEFIAAEPAAGSAGSKESHAAAPQGASAAHKTAASTHPTRKPAPSTDATTTSNLARPGSTDPAAPARPNASRPASAAPSAGVSTTGPKTAAPQAAAARSASAPFTAVASGSVAAAGPSSSASRPAAAAPASGATTMPSTPATPVAYDENVPILDPKLLDLFQAFKKAILPALSSKVSPNLGESLVLSAICRKLELTDATFVQARGETQRKELADAEKALMHALETRFKQYRSEKGIA